MRSDQETQNCKTLETGRLFHKINDLSSLSDTELIKQCMQPDKKYYQALEIIITRHHSLMDKRIAKTLTKAGFKYDLDIIANVRLSLLEKFYENEILKQAVGVDNFKAWLVTVVQNHTMDFIRKERQQKESPKIIVESQMVSLSEPLGSHENFFLEQITPDETDDNTELESEVNRVFGIIDEIDDKYRIIIKAAIMFYDPLSDEDVEEIARIQNISVVSVKENVEIIIKDLDIKHSKASRDYNRAIILWYYVNRRKRKLFILEKEQEKNINEIIELKKEIKLKSQNIEKLLTKCRMLIRPSSRQIAGLIGTPEDQSKSIDVLLFRAREILKKQNKQKRDR